MGLVGALAATRAHVLVLEAPGRPLLRLRAEAAVRARGWVTACPPGDTDLLLLCGEPAGRFAESATALWERVPSPRLRVVVRDAEEVPGALDAAERALASSASRDLTAPSEAEPAPAETSSAPPGFLHGPGTPWWPAGLVVTAEVRDGALAGVRVRVLAAAKSDPDPLDAAARAAATTCDEAARFLRLAGWALPAARLERVVDRVLAGEAPERQRRRVRSVSALAARSATLDAVLTRAVPGVDLRGALRARLAAAERAVEGGDAADRPRVDPIRLAVRLEGVAPASVPLLVAAGTDADG